MAYDSKDPDEIGALWAREYADKRTGAMKTRLTGTVNGVEVVCWPIDQKHVNQPSYRVKISRPRVTPPVAPGALSADDIPF